MQFANRADLESRAKAEAENYIVNDDGTTLCTILGGVKMYTDSSDRIIAPYMRTDGFWEAWISLLFTRLLKPGDTCLDVGANQGYYSLLMAACTGPSGYVGAVEPIPKLCKLIERSAEANGFGWLSVHNYAGSNFSGNLDFWVAPGQESNSSFTKPTEDSVALKVPVARLDDLFESKRRIDFIKIDAEGAEPQIIEGLMEIVKRSPNIRICVEWEAGRFSDPLQILRLWNETFEIGICDYDGNVAPITLKAAAKLLDLQMLMLRERKLSGVQKLVSTLSNKF